MEVMGGLYDIVCFSLPSEMELIPQALLLAGCILLLQPSVQGGYHYKVFLLKINALFCHINTTWVYFSIFETRNNILVHMKAPNTTLCVNKCEGKITFLIC